MAKSGVPVPMHEKWGPEQIEAAKWWQSDSPLQTVHETITAWAGQVALDDMHPNDAEDAKNLHALIASSAVRGDTELAELISLFGQFNKRIDEDPTEPYDAEQLTNLQFRGLMKVLWLGGSFQQAKDTQ